MCKVREKKLEKRDDNSRHVFCTTPLLCLCVGRGGIGRTSSVVRAINIYIAVYYSNQNNKALFIADELAGLLFLCLWSSWSHGV